MNNCLPTEDWSNKLVFVFIGALIAYFFQQIRVSAAEQIALVNDHIKDIEKFSDAAQGYWLKQPANIQEEAALAAKVRTTHAATTLVYDEMSKACGASGDKYRQLMQALFEAATGGSFETSGREIDPLRAIETHDTAAQLIHLLRCSRRDILSIRRIFRYRIDFDR